MACIPVRNRNTFSYQASLPHTISVEIPIGKANILTFHQETQELRPALQNSIDIVGFWKAGKLDRQNPIQSSTAEFFEITTSVSFHECARESIYYPYIPDVALLRERGIDRSRGGDTTDKKPSRDSTDLNVHQKCMGFPRPILQPEKRLFPSCGGPLRGAVKSETKSEIRRSNAHMCNSHEDTYASTVRIQFIYISPSTDIPLERSLS
ncbi:hypothetical protein ALC53_04028 [Atta colombica]|uniref:Uncharacterized protein n=1 Tax=Atta colombica TaxID=520822 RepID=A0A195BN28_9HYME|nr:hypothetical protein ALC53_04028 [Atta colombica]